MILDSDLWLDQPDHEERLRRKVESGEVTPAEGEALGRFASDGYLVLDLDVPEAKLDRVVEDVDALWATRPADVAYAYDGPARRMSLADPARDRKPRYRIHDIHSHSAAAGELYLDAQIFAMVRWILGPAAVAIQSLFFEYGSQQILHRDPVVVPTARPGHLLATWIALEDIGADAGALIYVPGSHRLPYYEFAPGAYEFDGSRMGAAEIAAATAFDDEQAASNGLAPRLFTARKGQALIWHGSLRHGGGPVGQPPPTRKSLVVHYSTSTSYHERAITIAEPDGAGGDRPVIWATREVIERDGCRGFQSPMLGSPRT
jgi:hypothetical protein